MFTKISAVLLLAAVIAGCTSQPTGQSTTNSTSSLSQTSVSAETETFTVAELKAFDGKGGNKCYVAVSGKVYDLTDSPLWVDGVHQTSEGRAKCGEDLTQVFNTFAPDSHKQSNYPSQYPQIGVLE